MSVSVGGARPARRVLPSGTSGGAVSGDSVLARSATAGPRLVGRESAMSVLPTESVGLCESERRGVRELFRSPTRRLGRRGAGKQQVPGTKCVALDVQLDLFDQPRGQGQLPPLLVLGVVLHDEAHTVRPILRLQFHNCPGDGEDSRLRVEVARPQLGQLTPAQAGLDLGLHQEAHGVVLKGRVNGVVLLDGDDASRLTGDGRGLDAASGMDEDHLIVQRGGEDRVEDDFRLPNRRWARAIDALQLGDPLAHVMGEQLHHPDVAQGGEHVLVEQVPVVLPRRQFDDVIRKPLSLDVVGQRLPAPLGIADLPDRKTFFSLVPRADGFLLGPEGPGRTLGATHIAVHSGVASLPIAANAFPDPPHSPAPKTHRCQQFVSTSAAGRRRTGPDQDGLKPPLTRRFAFLAPAWVDGHPASVRGLRVTS